MVRCGEWNHIKTEAGSHGFVGVGETLDIRRTFHCQKGFTDIVKTHQARRRKDTLRASDTDDKHVLIIDDTTQFFESFLLALICSQQFIRLRGELDLGCLEEQGKEAQKCNDSQWLWISEKRVHNEKTLAPLDRDVASRTLTVSELIYPFCLICLLAMEDHQQLKFSCSKGVPQQ